VSRELALHGLERCVPTGAVVIERRAPFYSRRYTGFEESKVGDMWRE
jgi:hypothetical protein